MIVDGAALQMYSSTRILVSGYQGSGTFSTRMGGFLYVNKSTVKSTASSIFWSGIETTRGAVSTPGVLWDLKKEGAVLIEHSTIENAENACRNYNKDFSPGQTCGGSICAIKTIFKNNKRSLLLHNENRAYNTNNPYVADGLNWNALFQHCDFIYTSTYPSNLSSQEMVQLTNCKNITFFSCNFRNQGAANISQTCAAIRGVSSSVLVQPYFGSSTAPRSQFDLLESGLVLSNGLQTDRVSVVLNSDFKCRNGINMSGCFNPLIGTNNFFVDYTNPDVGIYLNNCTGYKVEGNVFKGHPMGGVGIVTRNSGAAYNEIYRNNSPGYPMGMKVGVQSVGWNRNTAGTSGLKILCNSLAQFHSSYDISVMNDPVIYLPPAPPFGVANNQYIQGGLNVPNRSAGNVFYGQDGSGNNNDYFVQAGTNNINQFQYRYSNSNLLEYPSSSNIPTTNFTTANANTCPSKNTTGVPPYFSLVPLLGKLSNIESQIGNIEIKIGRNQNDTMDLDRLFTEQSELVDSMVRYYQYANLQDSVAFVYEQVTKGYQYKLYLAATYVGLGRHTDAIDLLSSLSANYNLSDVELMEVTNLATLYGSLKWLYLNEENWADMPNELKSPVYTFEAEDPTSAGAVARSLLARFEDRKYDPVYILPPEDAEIMMHRTAIAAGTKVYPNPAKDKLWLDWDGEDGMVIITDIAGRTILQQSTEEKYSEIDVKKLSPGLYITSIKVDGRVIYQQKIVKQ